MSVWHNPSEHPQKLAIHDEAGEPLCVEFKPCGGEGAVPDCYDSVVLKLAPMLCKGKAPVKAEVKESKQAALPVSAKK